MLSPEQIAKLKAEIERMEIASQSCGDSGIKERIEELIKELKGKLASEKKGPPEASK